MSRWHREHPDYDLTLEQLEREDRALGSGARAASETAASPVALAPRRVGFIRVEQRKDIYGREYAHRNHDVDETCRPCDCPDGEGWQYAPPWRRAQIRASLAANGGVCADCFGSGCASVAPIEDAIQDEIEDEKIRLTDELHRNTIPRGSR